jgi:hypothetical protein
MFVVGHPIQGDPQKKTKNFETPPNQHPHSIVVIDRRAQEKPHIIIIITIQQDFFWDFRCVVELSSYCQHCWLTASHTNPGVNPIAIYYVVTAWTALANCTICPKLEVVVM